MIRSAYARLLVLTLVALGLLLLWDASGLDLVLARMAGTPTGFPWRDDWFLNKVMHEGAKTLSWVLVIGLFAAIRWPVGLLRRLRQGERVQLAATALASVILISLLKFTSKTSCPWDLQAFGGVAQYVSHWAWGVRDGGSGNCFPAGHASAAFAYLGGYFVFRRASPGVARAWFACTLVAGLALGLSQQMRGAHFMSHTLWTAWFCWVAAFAIDALVRVLSDRRTRPNVSPKLNEA
ncbi:phosphatase PAP2 family protein [Variovorax ginsengisoli]|uniref:Phosphatase PAP2 family protein n=1 Tax=Variovorax ginsengisoli TaxID=363844 RepID=A0ABT8S448_9BURK|nr:phosphatase PAP2 family protein [Variovorax ginsengisoli]MDN8614516.1 phosphatase PAP2 family protein [Variovorax ginsengisoli]MDO1533686.1 phosphatase PAP2 family protein [Variovorax ginsengisoli]